MASDSHSDESPAVRGPRRQLSHPFFERWSFDAGLLSSSKEGHHPFIYLSGKTSVVLVSAARVQGDAFEFNIIVFRDFYADQ
jgi:hypothetical protein